MTFFGRNQPTEIGAERAHRRRWIVIPGVVVLVCVLVGMVSTIGAFHTREAMIRQTYPAKIKKIELESPGDLDVSAAHGDRATADWETHWNYRRPTINRSIDGHTMRLSLNCSYSVGVECFADLRLALPEGVALDVNARSGDISVRGVSGPVSLDNDSGDVRLERVSGDVNVMNKSGNVRLEHITGDVTAENKSGDVRGKDLRGRVARLETKSGDVRAEFATVPSTVTARTASGNAKVLVPADTGPYRVDTDVKSGEVDNRVRTDPSARNTITAATKSGDVYVGYGDHHAVPRAPAPPTPPTPPARPVPPEPD